MSGARNARNDLDGTHERSAKEKCRDGDGHGHDGSARVSGKQGQCLVACVEAGLARDFGEQLTLRDIERSSGYSVYQIIRTFRRRLGVTPHAHLIRMRVIYAAKRLRQGDTIAGAAAEAGFSDQSHMTRHFKRFFGTTPRQYLRNQALSLGAVAWCTSRNGKSEGRVTQYSQDLL